MSLKFCNTTSFQMNTLKKVLYNSNTLALTRLTIKKKCWQTVQTTWNCINVRVFKFSLRWKLNFNNLQLFMGQARTNSLLTFNLLAICAFFLSNIPTILYNIIPLFLDFLFYKVKSCALIRFSNGAKWKIERLQLLVAHIYLCMYL